MNEQMKKQYGLILKGKKDAEKAVVKPIASVFGDDDDDDKVDVSGTSRSAASLRTIKQAERAHELALAEDPTIFDYDSNYEAIERKKNQKVAEQKKLDEVRKSKYAENIMKSHQRRELERVSREERQQQRERETEAGQFDDKEVFVTGAYRKQMEEVAKLREEEEYEARFNALTSVEKQKVWQAGLSRTLLNSIARDDEEPMKKERNTRKRLESEGDEEDEKKKEKEKKSEREDKDKKSIYDSDPEDTVDGKSKDEPPHKNFSGELKAGLNRVNKKTKSQTVKERMFTPTPPSSDDEGKVRRRGRSGSRSPKRENRDRRRRDSRGSRSPKRESRDRRRRDSRGSRSPKRESRDRRRRDSSGDRKDRRRDDDDKRKKEKSPVDKKKEVRKEKPKDTEEMKKERFERLKEIVKKRNGPEQIELFRERYFERRGSNFVTLPL